MNMIVERISTKDDDRLDAFYRLKESQLKHCNEPEPGVFIAESELVIERALDAGFIPESFLIIESEEEKYTELFDRCPVDIKVYEVSEEVFALLKGFILIRGILGVFRRKDELTIDEVCKDAKRIVVLEEVENPTNVGAIFRNAIGLFADGILLTSDASDPLYRRSIRVSMGNVFRMKYAVVNKEDYIERLHELGFKTVALALRDDSVDIDDEKLNGEEKLAIILGSEGYGMSKDTIEKSDYVCKIHMNPDVDSLNVASASGIALWQLCSKRK